jgi:hypothetical protein
MAQLTELIHITYLWKYCTVSVQAEDHWMPHETLEWPVLSQFQIDFKNNGIEISMVAQTSTTDNDDDHDSGGGHGDDSVFLFDCTFKSPVYTDVIFLYNSHMPDQYLFLCPSIPPCFFQMACHTKSRNDKRFSSWKERPEKFDNFLLRACIWVQISFFLHYFLHKKFMRL